MSRVTTRIVADADAGLRLDRWFKTHYPGLRHGALEKLLRTGQIRVNGGRAKANRRVEPGETIRVPPIDDEAPPRNDFMHAPNRDDVAFIRSLSLYEDDQVLVLNKPFGLAVQGGTKTIRHIDGMLASLEKGGERPRLVHRLDQDTAGVLILAKTRLAAKELGHAFQGRDVEKTYWALCAGVPRPRQGTIDLPIVKRAVRVRGEDQERVEPAEGDDARKAITDFMTIDDAGAVSFVALRPLTGRTHQLRVHSAAMGTPIVGDRKYGGPAAKVEGVVDGMHLFCRTMTVPHPKTGAPLTATAPLTGRMLETWRFFSFDENADVRWPDVTIKKRKR